MAHVENVVKQGYLKKGSTGASRISGFFRRNETNKWFVFTIRQGHPYLEYYDNEVDVFSQPPINSFNLSECQNVKSMGNSNPPSFCIVCPDRVIELIASSRSQMAEWVNEIEASLIRLGVLQQDIFDHVYTICPAVIQKAKSNRDFSDEDIFQTSLKLAEDKRCSDTLLLTSSELRPDISFTQRSHSWQANNYSAVPSSPSAPRASPPRSAEPPPLPIRSHPTTNHNNKRSSESPPDLASMSHTGSSNDSDFVSPDIIAQLREVSKMRRSEERHDLAKDARRNSSNQKESNSNRNSNEGPNLSHTQIRSTRNSGGSSHDEAHTFTCTFDSESTFTCHSLDQPAGVEENDYSDLPCHEDSHIVSEYAGSDKDDAVDGPNSLSKPIPMPRTVLSKKSSNESPSGSLNNSFIQSSSLPDKHMTVDSTLPEKLFDNIEDEYPILIQSYKDYSDSKFKTVNTIKYGTDKNKSSKDENENFCGPILDEIPPPEELAPPIPPIPPLPPRKDSLPLRKNITSSDIKISHFEIKTSSTVTSMTTTHRQTNILDELAGAPPLPLPRKKGPQSSDSFRKSHPPSAFTPNGYHEIPPSLPRRPAADLTLISSLSDSKMPSLPSRSSQSFIIKRPQLTGGHVGLKEISTTESTTVKQPIEAKDHSSSSGLSRKMLLDRSHTLHTVVSLKKTQAEILQTEISMPSVTVELTQKSCHGLALVDWDRKACVAGWNQKDFPSLHGKLHVGDVLISVNNIEVTSSEMAQKLLRQLNPSKVDVVLRRMPYAKVFAIRKNTEGENLGIKREGGTGEIIYVDPNGLSAQHGLTSYATCSAGSGRCHWFLTEINNRPINLFFKENEIEHRLSAVGREITIVVQPYDFIRHIKHQFKKIKNYKSFITQ